MEVIDYQSKLVENGFKAYIIGGYTRDKLLGIKSFDIDIATSATPEEIKAIFGLDNARDNYGSIYFQDGIYSIDITTFRKDLNYKDRHPLVEFVSTLKEDVLRRDFTINSIGMDIKGNYIDYLNGIEDLENKLIKSIGNADTKFREDPLRMLRAVRFATTLDFKIEDNTLKSVVKNKELVKSLSKSRVKEEITLILKSNNALNGLTMLNDLGVLKLLEIEYNPEYKVVDSIPGMWAQLNYSSAYTFSKKETREINNIRSILDKGVITEEDIYNYTLDTSLIAGYILDIPNSTILDIYKRMPIKRDRDLALNGGDIIKLLGKKENNIKDIKQDLINNILSGNLSNEFKSLKEYIIEKWK